MRGFESRYTRLLLFVPGAVDGYADTSSVGSFPPNLHGMYDVFGNASEVVADCFHPNHDGAPTDGSARSGPAGCARVAKGGSPSGEPGFLRPALRVLRELP